MGMLMRRHRKTYTESENLNSDEQLVKNTASDEQLVEKASTDKKSKTNKQGD